MSSKLKQKKSKLNSAMFWTDALHEFVLNPEILIITERNILIHLDFSNLEFGKMIKKNWEQLNSTAKWRTKWGIWGTEKYVRLNAEAQKKNAEALQRGSGIETSYALQATFM